MILILKLLATAVLITFGLVMIWFGRHMGSQRERLEAIYQGTSEEDRARRCQRLMVLVSPVWGISLLTASVLVWVNPLLSVIIVALPFAVPLTKRPIRKN